MSLFEALGLRPELATAVAEMGFTQPTPIQQQAIPALLTDPRDLVGLAHTGTGKTAAFGLPLLHHTDVSRKSPQSLILCPTRELCLQITSDLRDFGRHMKGLRIVSVYGGASVSGQIAELRQGAQVVVGTPGRLIDLIERKALKLGEVEIAVLDEADEMLSMGFVDDIVSILSETPDTKRTWLFSATMPAGVERISQKFMTDPIRLTAGGKSKTAANIAHQFYVVHSRDRYLALRRIIDCNPDFYGIVFCRTRAETQEVADRLIRDGYGADALHGDLSQAQRDFVMKRFRSRTIQMLVATDVAARGIDVDDITHVMHYNLPDDAEVYTHRSGRTARAGKSGVSALIVGMKETGRIRDIERIVGKQLTRMMVPTAEQVCKQQVVTLVDKLLKEPGDASAIASVLPSAIEALSELGTDELVERFLVMLLSDRLASYRNAPDLNVDGNKSRNTGTHDQSSFTKYFISLGRLDGLYKADMLRYCCEMLNVDRTAIGRIDVQQSFSFVEVAGMKTEDVLKAFTDRSYRGRPVKVSISENQDDEGGSGGGGFRKREFGDKPYGGKDKPYGKKPFGKPEGGTGYPRKSFGDKGGFARKSSGGYPKSGGSEGGGYVKKSYPKTGGSSEGGGGYEKKSYSKPEGGGGYAGGNRADKFKKKKY